MSEQIQSVDLNNFQDQVLASDQPVLVDFWAPWCGPCRMVAPVLDQLAAEHAGRLRVVKINVDDNQEVASRYRVSSLPTFILFKAGQPADRIMGAMPKSAFQSFLTRNL